MFTSALINGDTNSASAAIKTQDRFFVSGSVERHSTAYAVLLVCQFVYWVRDRGRAGWRLIRHVSAYVGHGTGVESIYSMAAGDDLCMVKFFISYNKTCVT